MCFGPCRRLCHWGPLMALGIIKIISGMMIMCSYMILPPGKSFGGFLNMVMFLMFSGLSLYNHLSAMFEGPGYLPLNWCPENPSDESNLQFCKACNGFKAPRSHHCRKCGRCVLKMDHHCPWINNCVGHANHSHFTLFIFFSVLGSIQSAIVLSITLYRAFNRAWYMMYGVSTVENIHFSVGSFVLAVFALGLSIGVVLSVGCLLYFQIRAIVRNRTVIEDWILEKAIFRRRPEDPPFIYPYDLGWKKNFVQVINWNCEPVGDGITWPVAEGCNQYTLTIEQKVQKVEKRARTRTYVCVKAYSGWWFPVVHGLGVFTHPPYTDEKRLPLQPSDVVNVTRWRNYWLYGEKVGEEKGERGWFPKPCVVDMGDEDIFTDMPEEKKKDR